MLAQLPELVRDRVSEPEKASEVRPLADVLRGIFRPPTTERTTFCKRTQVRDAHDRYANQEVAYLLHRRREFRGKLGVSVQILTLPRGHSLASRLWMNSESAGGSVFRFFFSFARRSSWQTLAAPPIASRLAIHRWDTVVFSQTSLANTTFLSSFPFKSARSLSLKPAIRSPCLPQEHGGPAVPPSRSFPPQCRAIRISIAPFPPPTTAPAVAVQAHTLRSRCSMDSPECSLLPSALSAPLAPD